MTRPCTRCASGQSGIEYLVVCAALALALGVAMANQDSVLWQLAEAFRTAFRKFSYAISLPG
jgi:hypothetical protein